jgi:hypothetical protein
MGPGPGPCAQDNNITKVAMPLLISRDIYMYIHIKNKPSLQVAISYFLGPPGARAANKQK